MAKIVSYDAELKLLQKYIESNENEDAKRPMLFPLFSKLFKDKFTSESATGTFGADGYVEGRLIIEAKSNHTQWLEGFYQALHYKQKYGLSFNTIMIIAHNFVGVWKVRNLPEYAVMLANTVEATAAPSAIGKLNASKTNAANKFLIQQAAQYWLEPKDLKGELFKDKKSLITETYAIKDLLLNLESSRIPTTVHNFIARIEEMKYYFTEPIDAIHAFYSIIPYWDETSTASLQGANENLIVSGFSGAKSSDIIEVIPAKKQEFIKFINKYFIHTNNGSGLSVDYYFSRFDEVLAVLDPEYVKQHGIFFTDDNLSKFALWFAKNFHNTTIDTKPLNIQDYIVFDPAGGSGNLISSFRGKIKEKIISELQPDLLKIIEKRMKADPWHLNIGFTVVPKSSLNIGLNFLEHTGGKYYEIIDKAVLENTKKSIDKPLIFLLNPPYKNTDEVETAREDKDAEYEIHPDILELTGADAGKERYLAFLGQIINICKVQVAKMPDAKPIVMIFTPTSWLIPRPTYKGFRAIWDSHFEYKNGLIITSNEFFKLKEKWPLAFTIWKYNPKPKRENKIKLLDCTSIKKYDISFDWEDKDEVDLDIELSEYIKPFKYISFDNNRGDIRDLLPEIERKGKMVRQPRYNMYRNTSTEEVDKKIISGFPLKDKRHSNYNAPYGFTDGTFVGFMDDNTPVRLKQDMSNRMSSKPDKVWFMLMSAFSSINLQQIHSGAANSRSYCAYDKLSSQALFGWYAISKAIVGKYPTWMNQYEIWQPNISKKLENEWYALCYAFGLAENRCVVTKFEKDNPVAGTPEIWVDNPMSPNNSDSFYATVLKSLLKETKQSDANLLVNAIEDFYQYWNMNYTKNQVLENVGLHDEPYFKYFDYPDFVTKNSGLIQIKKYAEVNQCNDLIEKLTEINELTKKVKDAICTMLVDDFKYFE